MTDPSHTDPPTGDPAPRDTAPSDPMAGPSPSPGDAEPLTGAALTAETPPDLDLEDDIQLELLADTHSAPVAVPAAPALSVDAPVAPSPAALAEQAAPAASATVATEQAPAASAPQKV